jgi:hypothetical protein
MSNPYGAQYPQPYPPAKPGPAAQENTLGLVGFVLSLLGLFMCVAAPIGLILSLVGLRQEPKTLAVAGTVVGGIMTLFYGILALLYGAMILTMIAACIGLLVAAQPVAQTHFSLNEARQQIENLKWPDGTYPGEAEGNGILAGKTDYWKTPLRYEPQGKSFIIRSAGPDKQFNTRDDVTVDDFGSSLNLPETPRESGRAQEKGDSGKEDAAKGSEIVLPDNLEAEAESAP